MKNIDNKFYIIGTNESFYSFHNDVTIIKAKLILNISNLELRLNFVKQHISDTEPLTKTHLPSYNVGTFFKPQKKLVNAILKDNQLRNRPFYINGWKTDYSDHCSLTEIFIDLNTKEKLIMRAIKLIRIMKKLNKKKI
jgi:hypothetical protein